MIPFSIAMAAVVFSSTPLLGADWAGGCPMGVDFPTDAIGRSEQVVRRAYGRPLGMQDFTLGSGVNAARLSLRRKFPGARYAHLPVRELGWARGQCRIVVWFIRRGADWNAVHALRSNAAAEF